MSRHHIMDPPRITSWTPPRITSQTLGLEERGWYPQKLERIVDKARSYVQSFICLFYENVYEGKPLLLSYLLHHITDPPCHPIINP